MKGSRIAQFVVDSSQLFWQQYVIINYYLFLVFIVRIASVIQTGEKSNSQHMFYHVKLFTYGLKDSNLYILVFEKGIAWSKIQNLFMLMNMIG